VKGLGWSGDAFASDDLKATRRWLMSKSDSIAGGTSEIQRNIIAKRVLGLPD
jgi:alkylation response protein AidB-like acyl-CoA dehydrogenase